MHLCHVVLGVIFNSLFTGNMVHLARGEAKAASKVTFTSVIVAEMWELARMDI